MAEYSKTYSDTGSLDSTHHWVASQPSCHASNTPKYQSSVCELVGTDLPCVVTESITAIVDLLLFVVTDAHISAENAKCNSKQLQKNR